MSFEPDLAQLRALSAVLAEGTFEAAARRLHVTPSAVSQRIRALEVAAGGVVVVRSKPVTVTAAGVTLLRLARQLDLLVADAAAELAGRPGLETAALPVAVNSDSMATWVLPALAGLAGRYRFDLHRADESETAGLLRDGSVLAAVTGAAEPVPGCTAVPLGAMRYRALATPDFVREHLHGRPARTAFAAAPTVVFDRADELQYRRLRALGVSTRPPVHHVPASADFVTAVRLGFGWAMLPDLQTGADRTAGTLVPAGADGVLDVPLYWQQWKLHSPALDALTAAVTAAAARALRPAAVVSAHTPAGR